MRRENDPLLVDLFPLARWEMFLRVENNCVNYERQKIASQLNLASWRLPYTPTFLRKTFCVKIISLKCESTGCLKKVQKKCLFFALSERESILRSQLMNLFWSTYSENKMRNWRNGMKIDLFVKFWGIF
jgi:hypothetical protein